VATVSYALETIERTDHGDEVTVLRADAVAQICAQCANAFSLEHVQACLLGGASRQLGDG
jgi:hypothetical protein